MARKQDTYGLPDETLQLIASSPDLGFLLPQQGTTAQFAKPDVRRSDLISALRSIPGAANPGFTRYANGANGQPLIPSSSKNRGANNPAMLSMAAYVAPEVTLPGGESPPYIPPDVPPYVPPFIPAGVDPVDPVDPDPLDPTPLNPDPIDPDPIDPTPLDPGPEDPEDPEDPEPSIRTKIIDSDIPDEIDPNSIPFIPDFPLDLPEIPDVPDRTGVVEIHSSARKNNPSKMEFNVASMNENLQSTGVDVDEIKMMLAHF